MTPKVSFFQVSPQSGRLFANAFVFMILMAVLLLPSLAFAQTDQSGTTTTTCGFLSTVRDILNAVSVVVVTIAVIFTGYKVAFAHARISEVAPVMIGAVLIGAASQIAKIFLSGSSGTTACTQTGLTSHALDHMAVVVHLLMNYA